MSNENYNEEIDLMQIFGMIKGVFRKFLKLIISIILFYKKKAILFLIALIVGTVIGYFFDQNQDAKDIFVQEIIIEPKYNSTKYIYDFIEELEENIGDEAYLDKLGINSDSIINLKKISIEPIVKGTDVLDNLQERYENREFFKDIMEAYKEDQLKEEGFRDFYKHHKLVFKFKNRNAYNNKITEFILKYIKSNKYYKDISDYTLRQNKVDIERNKRSLEFIDTYLKNLESHPMKAENEVVIASSGEKVPMVSVTSLLQKKELLIELVNNQEKVLVFDKEIFSIVDYGDVISKRKKLLGRTLLLIPLILFGVISLFFFLRYLSKAINNFVKEE